MCHIVNVKLNTKEGGPQTAKLTLLLIKFMKFVNLWNCSMKMGDFIEPGTHRSTNIKVKIETVEKIRNVF